MDQLPAIIIQHEGIRLKPYTDTTGDTTIGIGRDLDSEGITQDEAMQLFNNDLAHCKAQLSQYNWYNNLDEVRQGVLIELVFNIGMSKFLLFKNMIADIKVSNYAKASSDLLDSLWAKQVGPGRANNMASRLLNGKYP